MVQCLRSIRAEEYHYSIDPLPEGNSCIGVVLYAVMTQYPKAGGFADRQWDILLSLQ